MIRNNLENLFNETPKEKTIEINGTLESINSVTALFSTHSNGKLGPGGSLWQIPAGNRTNFTIKTKEKTMSYDYNGIIFPDSIGNPIKIIMNQKLRYNETTPNTKIIEIFDQKLQRNYNTADKSL
ncbi:hypothetical protein KAT36_03840 [Candidatus Pacearchaeota archaeon]|nr:hypothetical protein [Candidatus Pacearchaeota archaeon]